MHNRPSEDVQEKNLLEKKNCFEFVDNSKMEKTGFDNHLVDMHTHLDSLSDVSEPTDPDWSALDYIENVEPDFENEEEGISCDEGVDEAPEVYSDPEDDDVFSEENLVPLQPDFKQVLTDFHPETIKINMSFLTPELIIEELMLLEMNPEAKSLYKSIKSPKLRNSSHMSLKRVVAVLQSRDNSCHW